MKDKMLILLLLLFSVFVFANDNYLKKVDFYPRSENDIFFRWVSDIRIKGDLLAAVVNFEHKIYLFNIASELGLAGMIGGPGEGPGELILPINANISKDEIAVIDETGVSFFKLTGEFETKFRLFSPNKDFVYQNDKVYLSNPVPEKPHLINVFKKNGELVGEFGDKAYKPDYNKFKGMSPFGVENLVNGGMLMASDNCLYYVNAYFGEIVKYSLSGEKLREINVAGDFGKKGALVVESNKKLWLDQGLDLHKTSGAFRSYSLFIDAILFKNTIYLFESPWVPGKKEVDNEVSILAYDASSLELSGKHVIKVNPGDDFGGDTVGAFAVAEKNGKLLFYVSVMVDDEYQIAVYAKNEQQ